jgi:hypothetical protein
MIYSVRSDIVVTKPYQRAGVTDLFGRDHE